MSFWERVGEGIGYALAASVLGPPAAMARRDRRAMRDAFRAWCRPLDPVPVRAHAERGLRRAVTLRPPTGAVTLEAELDPFGKRATLELPIGPFPPNAQVRLAKAPWEIHHVKMRMPEPIASLGGALAFAGTVDADTAEVLLREVLDTAFGARDAFNLDVQRDALVLTLVAPRAHEEWDGVANALVGLADTYTRRWSTAYR